MIGTVLAITVGVVLMTLYEWPKINQNHKKEKGTFVTITVLGWLLAILLLYFPDIPGPTQMVEKVFKPLGKLLEK